MKAIEKLTTVGKSLYGENWQSPLARALGVDSRTIRYCLSGERQINNLSARLIAAIEAEAEKALAIVSNDKMNGDDVTIEVIADIADQYEYADEQYRKTAINEMNNAVCEETFLSDLDAIALKWSNKRTGK